MDFSLKDVIIASYWQSKHHVSPPIQSQLPCDSAVTSASSEHISEVKCKRCVHYKELRSSHLKVRLQLFKNTCYSSGQKNTPGNMLTKNISSKCQQLPILLFPLPKQRTSKTVPSLHPVPPFLSWLLDTAQHTGHSGEDWQWGGSELNPPPAFQPRSSPPPPPPHPTNVLRSTENRALVCFSSKTQRKSWDFIFLYRVKSRTEERERREVFLIISRSTNLKNHQRTGTLNLRTENWKETTGQRKM